MGGVGSGARRTNSSLSSFCQMSVRDLWRSGSLVIGSSANLRWSREARRIATARNLMKGEGLSVHFQHEDEAGRFSESLCLVRIHWTFCRFGGARPWFECPTETCRRRVANLYGAHAFACRSCQHFSYPSQRVAPANRVLYRAQAFRIALGGSVDLAHELPARPRGMHTWTFTRTGLRSIHLDTLASIEALENLQSPSGCVGEAH